MSKIMTINFDFLEHSYYFLAHHKIKGDLKEYYITVMDGSLEKILYGNHVIKEQDGSLLVEDSGYDEQYKLKVKITEALSEYLHVPLTYIYKSYI